MLQFSMGRSVSWRSSSFEGEKILVSWKVAEHVLSLYRMYGILPDEDFKDCRKVVLCDKTVVDYLRFCIETVIFNVIKHFVSHVLSVKFL